MLKRGGNTLDFPLPNLKHSVSPIVAPLTVCQCFNRLNLGSLTHVSENSLNRNVWFIVFFLVVSIEDVHSWSHHTLRTLLHRVCIDKYWPQIYLGFIWLSPQQGWVTSLLLVPVKKIQQLKRLCDALVWTSKGWAGTSSLFYFLSFDSPVLLSTINRLSWWLHPQGLDKQKLSKEIWCHLWTSCVEKKNLYQPITDIFFWYLIITLTLISAL